MTALALIVAALVAPQEATALPIVARLEDPELVEASGVVASRRHPGVFWVHNDSGNEPVLFAVDGEGRTIRTFEVGTANIDWEDLAIDDEDRLWIGEIGNNGGRLPSRAIFGIDEPDPDAEPPAGPLEPIARAHYHFPDGDRFDAEGLVIREGVAWVVSKRFDGREAEVYAVPLDPPAPLLRPTEPKRQTTLPGFTTPATGADLSRDANLLAVCGTGEARVYAVGDGSRFDPVGVVRFEVDDQVEAICWDGRDLLLVGEGRGVYRISEATWRAGER